MVQRTYVRERVQELKESRTHAHQLKILDLSYYSNLGEWEKKARQVGPSQCNFQPHETYYASQIRERFVFYVVIYSFAFVKNLVRAGDHWKCENIRLSESTKYPAAGSDLGNCELTFECFFHEFHEPSGLLYRYRGKKTSLPSFLPFSSSFFLTLVDEDLFLWYFVERRIEAIRELASQRWKSICFFSSLCLPWRNLISCFGCNIESRSL